MKWFILVLLFYSCTVQAEESAEYEICKDVEEYAASVMKSRQVGASMASLYKIVFEQTASLSAKKQSVMLKIIDQAYKQHRSSAEEHQTRAVTEFRNKYFLKCIQGRLLDDG